MSKVKEWSLVKYRLFCESIMRTAYNITTMEDYLTNNDKYQSLVLRHDIDRFPNNALQMAKLEFELGIPSTYYVRYTEGVFSKHLIDKLNQLNREVGYHYEVMDTAKGNTELAIELFQQELNHFRQYVNVKTATAHGSPLSKWDNRIVWDSLNISDTGLIGEASLDIDYTKIAYYTDTGRCWDAGLTNLRDRSIKGSDSGTFPSAHTTDELIDVITSEKIPAFCIQTHPERWSIDGCTHARSVLWDSSTNFAKLILAKLRRYH